MAINNKKTCKGLVHKAKRALVAPIRKHLKDKTNASAKRKSDSKVKGGQQFKKEFEFVQVDNIVRIDELVRVMLGYRRIPHHCMAAMWHRLSRLIVDPSHPRLQKNKEQIRNKLKALLERTIDNLEHFEPKLLRQTALGIAKIIKAVDSCQSVPEMSYHQLFRDLLIGDGNRRKNRRKKSIFKAIASAAVPLVSRFEPQDYSLAYAYAIAKVSPALKQEETLFQYLSKSIIERKDLRSFEPEHLSTIIWSFATLNGKANLPRLFNKVAEAIIAQRAGFSREEISTILWAYASVGMVDSPIFHVLQSRTVALLERCTNRQLSTIAWSYAVVNVDAPQLFNISFTKMLLERMKSFTDGDLRMLYQWNLWHCKEKCRVGLPEVLAKRCYQSFTSSKVRISSLQRDVVSVLRSIGLKPWEEVLALSGYSLDALVTLNGENIGIEVDGPSHFTGRKPTGNTLLKRRLIANVDGITLVSVPYWEWYGLKDDLSKKQKYLKSLLLME